MRLTENWHAVGEVAARGNLQDARRSHSCAVGNPRMQWDEELHPGSGSVGWRAR
jgi:hypothetical protein